MVSPGGNAVMPGLLAACTHITQLPQQMLAATAWALFQQACDDGYVLNNIAQQALWALQSGECRLPASACRELASQQPALMLGVSWHHRLRVGAACQQR